MLNNSLVITSSTKYNKIFMVQYEKKKPVEIRCIENNTDSLIGNIYIARVNNVVKNLEAAFVEIEKGTICYYEPSKNREPIYIKRQSPNKMCQGDEILVQVQKDAHKSKQASVTDNLSFTGKYMVLTSGDKSISVSNKLSQEDKKRLLKLGHSYNLSEFGIIFRTNAAIASDKELSNELAILTDNFNNLMLKAKHKTALTLLNQAMPDYLQTIIGLYDSFCIEKIITDNLDIYENIKQAVSLYRPEFTNLLEYYTDSIISLNSLYGIDLDIDKALQSRVWLKSGAYLVIETTEAMTVIDVNTGKYEGNKKAADTFLKVNKEAAKEIARQLRLRNISGIIMVDFIDMDSESNREEIMLALKEYVKADPVKTTIVDMTKLNLVEITRRRSRRSLYEQLNTSIPFI